MERDTDRQAPALTVRFEELGSVRTFSCADLQQRADLNAWDESRRQYRVWMEEREAAFLTFDIFWDDQLNLYEIFVTKEMRGRGIGTEAILFAADLGRKLGKPRLTIRAISLSEQSQEDLIAWYRRRGLLPSADDPELLVMPL